MRQIVLDTETTGLEHADGHRIIEIGGVELINRRFTGKHFHRYINPERTIDEGALQVHGITNAFLADKPIFKDIIEEFLHYVSDAELIIHNAKFDVGFINAELALLKHATRKIEKQCKITDTLALARQKHPGQKNGLDALCKRYNVDNSKRELHGALLDAQLLAHVYLAMTGGQGTLFGEENATAEQQLTNATREKKERPPLVIIKADADELAAHKARLEAIQKTSKNDCLWLKTTE